ncbi:hypothetical protein [Elizabethkingia bruuniana]|uniref:hypothetical protein n=1 Tax=Elizabethkingia bruuniana TaxID=1756149 RepID=UPI00241FE302|nr:hypothetical protein [Elizabethkingia bruuniana]
MCNLTKILVCSIAIMVIIVSCSSRDTEKEIKVRKGNYLNLRILGVVEGRKGMASLASSSKIQPASDGVIVSSKEGVDFLVKTEARELPKSNEMASLAKIANIAVDANVKAITNGAMYEILIYKDSDTEHKKAIKITQDTNFQDIEDLEEGAEYSWFAYSFNTTGFGNEKPLPDLENQSGNLYSTDIKDQDLLYASGSFKAVSGKNDLNITFAHQTAIINLIIDSQGMSGPIAEESPLIQLSNGAGVNFLKEGDFNIFDGVFNNLKERKGPYIAKDSLPDYDNIGKFFRKIYRITTVVENPVNIGENSLYAQLGMNIIRKDPGTANGQPIRIPDHVGLKNINFQFDNGSIYTFSLSALESGVKVNGVTWARTNYAGTESLWRLSVDNKWRDNGSGTYTWPYKRYLDGSFQDSLSIAGNDVCTMLYPHVWRLPTQHDFDSLLKSGQSKTAVGYPAKNITSNDGLYGIQFELDSDQKPVVSYPQYSQKLLLQSSGYQVNPGGQPHKETSSGYSHYPGKGPETVGGYFWTKENNGSVGLATIRVEISATDIASVPSPISRYYTLTTDMPTIVGPNGDDYRYSVRCVRK